ncbi:MAG: tRNA ((37)-N6)-threonylcarbamoyltransferase complex dimerization subunit type 1 TsaB [Bacteroidota bacterium]
MSAYILHIETATKVCSVGLSENGNLLSFIDRSESSFIHGEALTLMIQELLAAQKLTLQQLVAISYSSGPGSYTGLRIGLSTAKGLCFALQIPLIALPTQQILAQISKKEALASGKNRVALLDARRNEVYIEVYAPNGAVLLPLSCLILEENSLDAYQPGIVTGDANQKTATICHSADLDFLETELSAQYQAELAIEKFEKKEFEDLAYCSPIYLKGANGVLL